MTTNFTKRPFLPSERTRSGIHIERAIFASALAVADPNNVGPGGVEGIAKRRWGEDRTVAAILKTATSPATTSGSGWADTLAGSAVTDFVTSLAPISAGARLLNACPRVSLEGRNTVLFPGRNAAIDSNAVTWVSESSPIPVAQLALTAAATLGPAKKLAVMFAVTRELMEYSDGETVLNTMLRENSAFSLDASLFSNTAASESRPAGLFNGVNALTASGAGATAMGDDLEKLSAAIAGAASGLTFICHPIQANAIKLKRGGTLTSDIQVWPTLGVASKTIIALDPQALCSAFGPVPEIRVSRESIVHMDSAPSEISTVGTPNVISAPIQSLWQTDCVAIRLILRAAWAWRTAGAVAWMQNVNWGGSA